MAIMIDFSFLAAAAPEMTNIIGKFILVLYNAIGNFGWTVVVFTIILKVVLSPLDIWQKVSQRKQTRSMARLQPKMQKLQAQYANKPDILKQKQAELYRTEKVSMFGMCLPTIITMVVFFVVFSGFNAMVRYQNEMIVYNIMQQYVDYFNLHGVAPSTELIASWYTPEKWLWIENIFMPDTWANVIPSIKEFTGSGIGALGASKPEIVLPGLDGQHWYDVIVGPAMAVHNKSSFWNIAKWNGYCVLPILSILTSVLSTKFMQAGAPQQMMGTEQQQKTNQTTQKVMLFVMPIMFGVFSLFYSAAFALYIFISNLISSAFGIIFTVVTKKKDKKQAEQEQATTYRR